MSPTTSRNAHGAAPGPLRGFVLTLAVLLVAALAWPVPPAHAATVYEITGQWAAGTPATVSAGTPVTGEWRVSVNDDGAAPTNDPVDNVTFTVVAQSGTFTGIPDACLTSGVTPVSALSADGITLTCNLGTVVQGTSTVVSAVIQASGTTGSLVSATGSIAGQTATLDNIPVDNPFGMDIRWQTTATSRSVVAATTRDVTFQWTLLHNRGAAAGPNSVTYTLTVTNSVAAGLSVGPGACQAFSIGAATGHPWSGGTHPTNQLAPFVGTCTLTRTSGAGTGSATFQLTLTGIDYSQAQVPTRDSANNLMPTSPVAVASGEIVIRAASTANAGQVTVASSAPTYTPAAGGAAVADDPANNTSVTNWTSGVQSAAWNPSFSGSSAGFWNDTFRAPAGTVIRQRASYVYANSSTVFLRGAQCITIDARYLEFVNAETFVGNSVNTGPSPAIPGAVLSYYTGTDSGRLDPSSPSYDPNAAQPCGLTAGWSTTLPADLTTVRAVRSSYPVDAALRASTAGLLVDTRIKTATPIGQDIWAFAAHATSTTAAEATTFNYPNRSTLATDNPASGTLTPGARYPFAAAHRDIMRTVGTTPLIAKSANPVSLNPGESSTYTLTYSAQGVDAVTPTVNNYTITDTLPVGLTYVVGSATPAPAVSTVAGQQTLTWTLNGVPVNQNRTLTYQATASPSSAPGTSLTNSVVSAVDGQTSAPATATVRISNNGFTQVSKSSDQAYIPNAAGDGAGAASWTVSVSSSDPTPQTFTDTIDVLPYLGDGRGTDFAGSYDLSGAVVAPAGATVYYSTAAPGSVSLDPADSSNGAAGSTAGNTVGWSTTYTPAATAVRVIGGALNPGAIFQFTIPYVTTGMESRDLLVNTAVARAQHTALLMRTSSEVSVATFYSASLKKYVRNPAVTDPAAPGYWLDANDPAGYPQYGIGDTVQYLVVVTNTGQTPIENITVTDDLEPALGAFVIDSLPVGGSQSHEYSVVLDADEHGAQVVNTACASAPQPPDATSPVQINCDPAGLTILNHPDVEVAKGATPESGTEVAPGDTVTYQIDFTNTGTLPAAVDFTDHLTGVLDDADFVIGSIAGSNGVDGFFDSATGTIRLSGVVPAGVTASVTYQVTVKTAGFGDGLLTNVVRPTGEEPPATCEPDDPLCTEHPVPGILELAKSAIPAPGSTVTPGQQVQYILTLTNTGGRPVSVDHIDYLVGVLDDADFTSGPSVSGADLTATRTGDQIAVVGSVPPGATYTVSYTVTVKPAGSGGDNVLRNVVRPTGQTPPDPEEPCAADDLLCTEHFVPGFTLTKTADPVSGSTVVGGDTITYTVTGTNTGATVLDPVTLTDDLSSVLGDAVLSGAPTSSVGPAPVLTGTTVTWSGSLPVGGVVVLTYTVTLDADIPAGTVVNNRAEGSAQPPSTPENPVPPITPPPVETEHPVPGFELTKTADPVSGSTVVGGDTITYTVTGTNTGATVLDPVTLTDDLSSVLGDAVLSGTPTASVGSAPVLTGTTLTWTGSLPIGGEVVLTYAVVLDSDIPAGTVVNNRAEGSAQPPSTPENPVPPITPPPVETEHPVPGFELTKTSAPVSGSTVVGGQTITYTVTGTNTGATVLAPVDLSDDLSAVLDNATLTGVPTSSVGAAPILTGTELTWSGTLPVGGAVVLTYTVTVDPDVPDGTFLNNHAEGSAQPPSTPENPVPPITPPPVETQHSTPGFTLTKTADPVSGSTVVGGDTITYTVTGTNTGATVLDPVELSDDLSQVLNQATLTGVPTSSVGAAPVLTGTTLTWSGSLPVGGVVVLTYTVTLNDDIPAGTVVNNRAEGSAQPPSTPENPVPPITPPPVETEHPVPGFELTKTADPVSGSTVVGGDTITYTVTGTNTGATELNPVLISDDLASVLDNATLVGTPTASVGALPVLTGTTLTWSGTLPVGTDVVLTYSVLVNADLPGGTVIANRAEGSAQPPSTPENPVPPITPPPVETEHPVPGFELTKTADPVSGSTVQGGDTITYTVTGTNTGATVLDPVDISDDLSQVLDNATVTGVPTASTGAAPVLTGTDLTWTGVLPVGGSVVLTYTVTVDPDVPDGTFLNNHAEGSAQPPSTPENPVPPITPPPVETQHSTPGFTLTKTADPAPGTIVQGGATITYTVTGTNTGAGVLDPVVITDDLSGVLPFGTLAGAPTSTVGDAPVLDGQLLTWTGTLAEGQAVVLTYSITLATEIPGGIVRNVVTGTATPPDGPPIQPPPAGTEHPVPGYTVTKTADPVSGTAVKGGDTITYTVTGTNTGATVLNPVVIDDDLAGVLTHAALVGTPTVDSSAGVLTVEGQHLTWTGSLPVGASVTITYQVLIDADVAEGSSIRNEVTSSATPVGPPGTPPGTPIVPPPAVTEHPVPGFVLTKVSDVPAGATVKAGDRITYTVTGTNLTAVPLDPVVITDDMARVLDNTALVGAPGSDVGDAPVVAGTTLTWTGSLAGHQVVTLTYTVQVKAGVAAGTPIDNVVGAVYTPPGLPPVSTPKITVRQVTDAVPPSPVVPRPPLPNTGVDVLGFGLTAAVLLLCGAFLSVVGHRRRRSW